MFKNILAISLIFFSSVCFSGELIRNATILEVASNGSNTKNFAVLVSGGTGISATERTRWVYFPELSAPSLASYNQSFSLAVTALTTDKKVRIHNYSSDSCEGANFISVNK